MFENKQSFHMSVLHSAQSLIIKSVYILEIIMLNNNKRL